MRRIDLIVIHCSATKVTQDYSAEDLRADHQKRGYKTTGYHYYITKDGHPHRCRPEEMVGAHALHYNAHSIGICYEGGLDANGEYADTRTTGQKHTLVALLRSLKVDYPDAKILGHRDLPGVKKQCPCFDAQSEYNDLQPLLLEQ